MRKSVIIMLLVLTSFSFSVGQGIAIDAGASLTCSQRFDSGNPFSDALIGLRGGVWGDMTYCVSDIMECGIEVGMYYFSWEPYPICIVFMSDLPITVKASFIMDGISLDVLLLSTPMAGTLGNYLRFALGYQMSILPNPVCVE